MDNLYAQRRYLNPPSPQTPKIGVPWHSVNRLISAADIGETMPWSVAPYFDPDISNLDADGRNVLVGIADTGIDTTHRDTGDLEGAIAHTRDFTGSRFGVEDRNGHGTHVAGIIGARYGNGKGVAGVAPGCQLAIAKGLGDGGSGSDVGIAAAIDWLVEVGCKIINLSLGSRTPSPAISAAIDRARLKGRLVVVAAGNDGIDPLSYPGRELNNISVGAVDRNRTVAWFSNFEMDRLDIAAPGVGITSTYSDGGYADLDGTSMAAPSISGLMARKLSIDPDFDLDVDHVREWFESIADDAGEPGKDARYGYGLVNVRKAHQVDREGGGGSLFEFGPVHSPARATDFFTVGVGE